MIRLSKSAITGFYRMGANTPAMLLWIALAVGWVAVSPNVAADERPVIVGWTEAAGFSSMSEDDELRGFFVELARMISEEAGFPIVFREFDSIRSVIAAQSTGDSEMIAGLARLPANQATNVYSDPVAQSHVRLYVRAEESNDIRIDEIENRRVGIVPHTAGSEASTFLKRNRAIPLEHYAQAQQGLMLGDIDAFVLVDAPTGYMLRRSRLDHRIVPLGSPLASVERFVALHESRGGLLERVNVAIATLETNGRLDALRRQWAMQQEPGTPEVLTVGIHDFPPFVVTREDGTVTGFSVEVLKSLADNAGLMLRFQPISSEEWRAGPRPGAYDLLPQASINSERRTRMDFTQPIESSPLAIYVRAGEAHGLSGLSELTGRRVGVSRLNVSGEIARRQGNLLVIEFPNLQALLQGLIDGEIDALLHHKAAVAERAVIEGVSGRVEALQKPFAMAERGIVLRFGLGDVRERLNSVLPGFLASTEYADLHAEFLKPPAFWTEKRIRQALMAGAVLLSGLVTYAFVQIVRRRKSEQESEIRRTQFEKERAHKEEISRVLRELEKTNADLEQSNAELDSFAYAAAHDLKSPLRNIDDLTEWLVEDLDPHLNSETRELMQMVRSRVQSMSRLLDDMMEHAQIGRVDVPKEIVSGEVLMSEIVALSSLARGFTVTFASAFADISVPRMPLLTVLLNLVSNAIKHHDLPEGQVQILLEDADTFFCISVQDNGPGIPEAYHQKIFDLFQTLQPKDERGGSGMGLAIVNKHVVNQGGRIEVESNGARGTRFHIFWPKQSQVEQLRGAA